MTEARTRRRDQLLELGLRLFADKAYEDVVIDEIATEAGISRGLLYHYFGSKRGFYTATVELATRQLVEALVDVDKSDPLVALEDGLQRYLDFLRAHELSYRALMKGGLAADPDVQAVLDGARSVVTDLILEAAGLTGAPALFRVAVRSWIGGVEAGSIEVLDREGLDDATLVGLHAHALGAALDHAARAAGHRLPPTTRAAVDRALGGP